MPRTTAHGQAKPSRNKQCQAVQARPLDTNQRQARSIYAKHDRPMPSKPSTTAQCQAMQCRSKQCQSMPGVTNHPMPGTPSTTTHRQAMLRATRQCQAMQGTASQCRARPTNANRDQPVPRTIDQCHHEHPLPTNDKHAPPMPSTVNQGQTRPRTT